ncbi:hypothetical protein EV143_10458 [Flavobacterium chryseum]|uniref:hypothetical protein n=1 Tax=Flavobacterium sp. P3160 TaxID=2512113 RepID=UPI00105DCE93|nr:hypothetical protein [Flavobacterium sp. P3160]TDO77297.1 hypothetical protein EV143_10458 [Flavobacterium sp. P3160]
MNEIFQIRENGFEEIKKQLIIKSLPTLLVAISFGFAIVFFNAKEKGDVLTVLPFMIPFLILSMGYGISKGLKRQKIIFQTFRLTFSENNIVREQANTPTVTIPFTDIHSIIKDKKGGYAIKGKTAVETILVPAQIENHENFEIVLSQVKPIEQQTELPFEEKYRIPILLVMLVCMATVYVSYNKILVGICCVVVSTLLIRSSIQILKNKNIDNKSRRIGYYSLVVLASVIGVTILKFSF